MIKSTIGNRHRITIPKELREKLHLSPGDVLLWEVVGKSARVSVARSSFLDRRNSIQVGAGSTVEDVRAAREHKGASEG